MDARIKRSLISYARRLSISWAPRVAVKKRAKVAPATYECSKCGKYCYEGSSEDNYKDISAQFPDKVVEMTSIDVDHIVSVVDVVGGMGTWDEYFERLFCDESNFRCLCPYPCHYNKTQTERLARGLKPSKYKQRKKKK